MQHLKPEAENGGKSDASNEKHNVRDMRKSKDTTAYWQLALHREDGGIWLFDTPQQVLCCIDEQIGRDAWDDIEIQEVNRHKRRVYVTEGFVHRRLN